MRRRLLALIVVAGPLMTPATGRALHAAQDWNAADKATKRLPPSAITTLPPVVRAELERRGCTIPQPFSATHAANAIRGRFISRDQTDWAVLCSRQRRTSLLVFPGGSTSDVSELAARNDIDSLQTIGGTRWIELAGSD